MCANSELVKGQLTFHAVEMTYSIGTKFPHRWRRFRGKRMTRIDIDDYPFG
jgi:hypothetical protein